MTNQRHTSRLRSLQAVLLLAVLGVLVGLPFGDATAKGSRGAGLSFRGCITAFKGVADRGPCRIASTSSGARLFFEPESIVISPNGRSLYTAGSNSTLMHFARDPATGALGFRDCLTGATSVSGAVTGPCIPTPGASNAATGSGLDRPAAMAVSRDGRSLYAVNGADHSVAAFTRDPATGSLSFNQCLTGAMKFSGVPPPAGTPACIPIPTATEYGFNSGLYLPIGGVVITSDARAVYPFSTDGVLELARDQTTGELSFQGCLVAGSVGAHGLCEPVRRGAWHPITGPASPVASADGRSVYAVGQTEILRFDRNPGSGTLVLRSCYTEKRKANGCTRMPARGLLPGQLVISPDGRFLYGATVGSPTLTAFRRKLSGRLVYRGCVTADVEVGSICRVLRRGSPAPRRLRLPQESAIAVSPEDGLLYTTAFGTSTLAVLDANRAGPLHFRGCVTGSRVLASRDYLGCAQLPGATKRGRDSGLFEVNVEVSPDGSSLYLGSIWDNTIARFQR